MTRSPVQEVLERGIYRAMNKEITGRIAGYEQALGRKLLEQRDKQRLDTIHRKARTVVTPIGVVIDRVSLLRGPAEGPRAIFVGGRVVGRDAGTGAAAAAVTVAAADRSNSSSGDAVPGPNSRPSQNSQIRRRV